MYFHVLPRAEFGIPEEHVFARRLPDSGLEEGVYNTLHILVIVVSRHGRGIRLSAAPKGYINRTKRQPLQHHGGDKRTKHLHQPLTSVAHLCHGPSNLVQRKPRLEQAALIALTLPNLKVHASFTMCGWGDGKKRLSYSQHKKRLAVTREARYRQAATVPQPAQSPTVEIPRGCI